jgi:hypothetical protein
MTALLTAEDFRLESLADPCQGLQLTVEEAPDSRLTAAISRLTERLEALTGDDYDGAQDETITFSLYEWTDTLILPKRCTGITSVTTIDRDGTETIQAATAYRLLSSLNTAGDEAIGDYDALLIVNSLVSVPSAWSWPTLPYTVEVVGDFGWLTPPADAAAALAELVWDHFKRKRGDLGRAASMSAGGETIQFIPVDNGLTGIKTVDDFIQANRYEGRSGPTVLVR